jgi:hypothetical protein
LAAQLPPQGPTLSPVYRLVNNVTNDHVYSIDAREVNILAQQGSHNYEGVAFQVFPSPFPGTQPLHRFVRAGGQHVLDTRNPSGADPFARFEATLGYVAGQPGPSLVPLHVWLHPQNGLFFYTTHPQGEFAAQNGYVYRGVLGYVGSGG